MKVLLFSEGKSLFQKSGVGKALEHQVKALESCGVEYTFDPNDNDYNVAHINTVGLKSIAVLRKCKKRKIPVICHTHTTYEDFKNSFFFSNIFSPIFKLHLKYMYSMADFHIYPSEYTKNLVNKYGVKKHGSVISNGVDMDEFSKDTVLVEKFKKEFNIKTPLIISVGLPFERKGVVEFYELANELPEYTFIWFGAKITNLLPKKIKNIIENPPKNLLFPGYVSNEILLGAYGAADAFLFPTFEENEGIVVLEALACGTPLVVRDIPVYKKWLRHGFNSYKGRDKEELKSIVIRLVENKAEKNILKNGVETAKERSIPNIGNKLKYTYEMVTHAYSGSFAANIPDDYLL